MNRVGWVNIYVSDMDRAVDFYENNVGIPVRDRSPEFPQYVELDTEGATLALSRPAEVWPGLDKLIGRNSGITLTVPDIQSKYSAMTAKGVRFAGPPTRQPWGGVMTSFFDLDGNEVWLLERSEG